MLASSPQRAKILASLTAAERKRLLRCWPVWARPDQLPPQGEWQRWLILAGRGWGKTRTGAEWVRERAARDPGCRIALVARTAADVRDVIVEGESGILAVHAPGERPTWEPSRRRLTWPNGSMATTYSADVPDQLRGPQHHYAWADELASWERPDTWDQLVFGLRLGTRPQVVITTTPRPTPIIRALLGAPGTVVTRGRTLDNRANLAPGVVADLQRRYGGTRLGRQELDGEVLTDTPGSLWTWERIEAARVAKAPDLRRVIVAIDPAVSTGEGSDETGIVVAAIGYDGRGYVLEDASGKYSPDGWARRAVHLAAEHRADRIVAEVNNGGQLVEHTLRTVDNSVSYKAVHASRGKTTRAEPVAALYEQGRVSHVGRLDALESQMTGWDPSTSAKSPDRMDALVWALTELMVDPTAPRTVTESSYDF